MGGEGFSGTTIKDTWTKPRERVDRGREVILAEVWQRGGEKMQTTVIEKQ